MNGNTPPTTRRAGRGRYFGRRQFPHPLGEGERYDCGLVSHLFTGRGDCHSLANKLMETGDRALFLLAVLYRSTFAGVLGLGGRTPLAVEPALNQGRSTVPSGTVGAAACTSR